MLDKQKHTTGQQLPYLRNSNVRWGVFDLSDLASMYFEQQEEERFSIRKDDLVVCEGGEPGRAAVWRAEKKGILYQKALHRVRPYGGLSPHWIQHALQSAAHQGLLEPYLTGTTIKHLPKAAFKSWEFPIAPLPEQQRVIEVLDSYLSRLDAATEALKRVEANLKRYRASVLKAAVEGRLVPTEAELARAEGRDYEPASVLLERILQERRRRWEETELAKMKTKGKVPKNDKWKAKYKEPAAPDTRELPELPEGWCWASVDQLSTEPLINGRSVKTRAGGFPVLRLTAVKGLVADLAERKEGAWSAEEARRFCVKRGDFLISRGNGSIHLVGRGALVAEEPAPVAFPDTLVRLRLEPELANRRYFAHVWNSALVRSQIEQSAKTTAGIYKVNQGDLRGCRVALPPIAEQDRLAEALDRGQSSDEALTRSLAREIGRLPGLRQSILKWAFEGKLVDQDPNDEPASVLLERIQKEREIHRRKERPRRFRKRTRTLKEQDAARDLVTLIKQGGDDLSPEELFQRSKFSPENIDEFFALLRSEVRSGEIEERRSAGLIVRLRAAAG